MKATATLTPLEACATAATMPRGGISAVVVSRSNLQSSVAYGNVDFCSRFRLPVGNQLRGVEC